MPEANVEKLLERLAARKPVPGVLLLGSDGYLREICRKKIVEAYVEEASRDWAVARFSAREDSADVVLGQAQTLPMLAPRQVVFWSELEAQEKLGEKARDAAVERLTEYLESPAPFTVLVLEAEKLDERTRLFKLLSSKVIVVTCELTGELPERVGQAAVIAVEMAREIGVKLDREAAQCLAEWTNAGLARIRTELEKLLAYAGDRAVTRADVEALVVSDQRYSVWQLSEMLATGDRTKAMVFLESLLREGEQPVGIVGAMAWMFRKLIEVQELPRGATPWDAARLGMRRDTAEMALKQAPRIPREQLTSGLRELAEADNRLKSGNANPRAVMEFLVARLTARQNAGAAAAPGR
jgi:DNA polymerase-3 subunit delta